MKFVALHLRQVTEEQGWMQTNTHCNLILRVITTTGELAEYFQWVADHCIILNKLKVAAIAQDLLIFASISFVLIDILGITWHKCQASSHQLLPFVSR